MATFTKGWDDVDIAMKCETFDERGLAKVNLLTDFMFLNGDKPQIDNIYSQAFKQSEKKNCGVSINCLSSLAAEVVALVWKELMFEKGRRVKLKICK